MEEKYIYLNEFAIALKSFMLRLEKENLIPTFHKKLEYINSIELSDEVVNDIIQLIKDKGNLTLKQLIKDVNLTIKECNWVMGEKNKIRCVKNKTELIKYMKSRISTCQLLTDGISSLIAWDATKLGIDFYTILNITVNKSMRIFRDIIR